ncbi:unknown [Crocosphaera subtropica ATCC 51142]|uniref:Uncharacterized protein n=1 Tax=Crocosphaera subtropica (strain ATCC 51142 / BH68) TaxID=43989 RepID=B1WW60_CROS5|nr:unknown [Crocosphaera subtropica ATCC 51142]
MSTTLPIGSPPPKARSRVKAPVEMVSTFILAASPRRIMEPLPKFRSIWLRTKPNAFSLSGLFVIAAINASIYSYTTNLVQKYLSIIACFADKNSNDDNFVIVSFF